MANGRNLSPEMMAQVRDYLRRKTGSSPRPKLRPGTTSPRPRLRPRNMSAIDNKMGLDAAAPDARPFRMSDADRQRAMDRASMLEALESGPVRGYNKGGRVEKILRGLGEGSDMSVAALLRMIEAAGMGSGVARAATKAAGMDTRGKGATRAGRQLNRMGVSDDIIEMLEGTRPGRKAPLQALGMKKGGAVKKKRTKKPKNGCTMKGRGGKYKGMK